nr:hypothetical protein [Leptolyngbyaceae cyanobacterium MAG.088]
SSDQGSSKTTESKQSASPKSTSKSTSKSPSQSTSQSNPSPQTVKIAQPATVTVQRQIADPKPTIIQACNDESAAPKNSSNEQEQETNHDYSQYLELLVQEVYSLLRQRLSLEQERRGPRYPR